MFFKDIGKSASDFFNKDFPTNHKVDVNSHPVRNTDVKVTAAYKGENTTITVEPKYRCAEWNAEVSAEVNTNNFFKASANVSDKLVEGLKTTVSFTSADVQKVNAGVEFKNEYGTAKADFDFPSNNKTAANFGVVVEKNEFAIGVDGRANLGGQPSVANINGGVQYRRPEYTTAVFVRSRGDALAVQASYIHGIENATIAAHGAYNVNDASTTLAFGWAKRLNDGSVFKTKFGSDGTLSASYKRSLSRNAAFVAGTKINTSTLAGQVGVHLSIAL